MRASDGGHKLQKQRECNKISLTNKIATHDKKSEIAEERQIGEQEAHE